MYGMPWTAEQLYLSMYGRPWTAEQLYLSSYGRPGTVVAVKVVEVISPVLYPRWDIAISLH